MRVAIEILAGAKSGRLQKPLVEGEKLATAIAGVVEPGPRAAVAAIEIVPANETAAPGLEERLDGEIAQLAEPGPSVNEVATAKAFVLARIEKARKAAQPTESGKKSAAAGAAALPIASRVLLDPAAYDRIIAQFNEVSPNAVKLAAKRLLAKDYRVVVIATPAKKPSDPLAMP